MVECFKTLMLCLNRIGCPKDIKGLIKNKIIVKIVKNDYFGHKEEWFELFGKKHGLHRGWYLNGKLSFECMYKDGKGYGVYRAWFENDRLKIEIMYKDGKVNGFFRMWRSNGQLIAEHMFKDGKKNGLERRWDGNGQLRYEIMYKDDEKIEILN